MVNVKRVKRKIPCLLVKDSTTKPKNRNIYLKISRNLDKLQKNRPEVYNNYVNQLVVVLNNVEVELNNLD